MSYVDQPGPGRVVPAQPVTTQVIEYHDRVRWGPIVAGLVVAIGTQLVLSSLGAALGLTAIATSDAPRSSSDDIGSAIGIWTILSLFASLFAGGWVTARTSGPITRNGALLNGAILWATTLALGSYLLASGVSGALGVLGTNPDLTDRAGRNIPNQLPGVSADQARDIAGNAARGGWSFAIGALLGLGAALGGAFVGSKDNRIVDERGR
ncbi:hypothetical protein [Gloeobacter morelensis]|uniref:PhnA-like protein n=1 Tax=Gloeobacter morelensis MG652769 TaxID=2781736 RepID=A0ABY3PMT2_9CYAN|nr:hypothetical protein [Gloeobacter morelensis]UFP94956.1 hypothetical protein ISF26_01525 [Gloeobacter morelensis MG652769]